MSDRQQMLDVVIGVLTHVAPNIDPAHLNPDADLAQELDIDSMDFLNVVVEIHEKTGIEVPERDYPKLSTLNAAVAYLEAASARPTG